MPSDDETDEAARPTRPGQARFVRPPRVSVVVAVTGSGWRLRARLRSVRRQTLANLEALPVGPARARAAEPLLLEAGAADPRVRRPIFAGAGDPDELARAGLARAGGDFVCLLAEADHLADPYFLEAMYEAAIRAGAPLARAASAAEPSQAGDPAGRWLFRRDVLAALLENPTAGGVDEAARRAAAGALGEVAVRIEPPRPVRAAPPPPPAPASDAAALEPQRRRFAATTLFRGAPAPAPELVVSCPDKRSKAWLWRGPPGWPGPRFFEKLIVEAEDHGDREPDFYAFCRLEPRGSSAGLPALAARAEWPGAVSLFTTDLASTHGPSRPPPPDHPTRDDRLSEALAALNQGLVCEEPGRRFGGWPRPARPLAMDERPFHPALEPLKAPLRRMAHAARWLMLDADPGLKRLNHGDLLDRNLWWPSSGGTIVFLDFEHCLHAPLGVDLGWLLAGAARRALIADGPAAAERRVAALTARFAAAARGAGHVDEAALEAYARMTALLIWRRVGAFVEPFAEPAALADLVRRLHAPVAARFGAAAPALA